MKTHRDTHTHRGDASARSQKTKHWGGKRLFTNNACPPPPPNALYFPDGSTPLHTHTHTHTYTNQTRNEIVFFAAGRKILFIYNLLIIIHSMISYD